MKKIFEWIVAFFTVIGFGFFVIGFFLWLIIVTLVALLLAPFGMSNVQVEIDEDFKKKLEKIVKNAKGIDKRNNCKEWF